MSLVQFFRIVEIRTKVVSLSSFSIGTALAWYRLGHIDVPKAVLFLAALLCVDMGTTAFNSFFDYMRDVDSAAYNREGDKVLVHGGVAPGVALIVSVALFFVAAVLGIVLAFLTSGWILLVGALGLLVGFLYNGGPIPISSTPVGELASGLFLGAAVVVLAFLVHGGSLSTEVAVAALPSLLFVASILTTNNTCDAKGDRAAGRKTLSVLLGAHVTRWLIYLQGLAAYGVLFVAASLGVLPATVRISSAVGAVLSVLIYVQMHRRGFRHETKGPSMQAVLRSFGVFTLAVVVPLLLGYP